MEPALLFPAVAAVVAALSGQFIHRRMAPQAAVRALTATAVAVALAVVWGTVLVLMAAVAQLPVASEVLGWCHRTVLRGHRVPPGLAVALVLLAALASSRAVRRHRRYIEAVRTLAPDQPLSIVELAEPAAFAVPGDRGGIVVSTGMLQALSIDERRALVAHEQAHLDLGHHRYTHLVDTIAAALPVLSPIATAVRFATERWADEVAASEVGDRRLVARAIAHAALAGSTVPPRGALGITGLGSGTPARVQALLREPLATSRAAVAALWTGGLVLAAVLTASTVQLHHLVLLATRLCKL